MNSLERTAAGAFLVLLLFLVSKSAPAAEADYARAWCAAQGGRAEVVLPDRTRADCVTATHAIEVEYAAKWKQAPGQALHYARLTGRRAGIVLIAGETDARHVTALRAVLAGNCLAVDVWTVPP